MKGCCPMSPGSAHLNRTTCSCKCRRSAALLLRLLSTAQHSVSRKCIVGVRFYSTCFVTHFWYYSFRVTAFTNVVGSKCKTSAYWGSAIEGQRKQIMMIALLMHYLATWDTQLIYGHRSANTAREPPSPKKQLCLPKPISDILEN